MVRGISLWWLLFESVQPHRIARHLEDVDEEGNAAANQTAEGPIFRRQWTPNYWQAMDHKGTALAAEERGGICPSDCLSCCKKNLASSKKGFRCITDGGLACPRGRKCRSSYLTGSHKMSRFTTYNGVHQRVAMAAFWRFVWYTEEEMKSKPKQFMCPHVNTFHPVFRVPFSKLPFKELKSKESWLEQVPQEKDGGWLPAPKLAPTAFQCPHECIECCSTIGGFTCVLRENTVVPTNRECKDIKKRNNADGFYVNCKLTDLEKKLPKALRKFPSCATRYKCCCPDSDHWTQEVCMPPGTPQAIEMESYRGTQELFLAAPEGALFQNRGGHCVMPGSFGVHYDTPAPSGGCCLKRVRYCCRRCDDGCCRWCWRCTQFEMVHTCSQNGGMSPTGELFRRTASGQGTCINNGPENNFTLFRHNNPDALGVHRYVPTAAKKYKLAGILKRCPLGTFQFGADKQECRCESDKPRCQSKLWNAIGLGAHDYSRFRRIQQKPA